MAFAEKLIKHALKKNLEAAEAAKFDVNQSWFHGGKAGMIDEIDPAKFGSATGTPAAKRAFFLVDNEDTAKGFAERAGGDVHEFLYRPEGTTTIDWEEFFPGLSLRSNNGQRALAAIIEDLKEQGAAGLLIKNADDTARAGGRSGNVLAVIDPTRLRYPSAEFKDLTSRSTTASVGAGIVGGAALSESDKAQAFIEPKGNFAKKLVGDYVQTLRKSDNFGLPTVSDRLGAGRVQAIEAPKNEWAAQAADWFDRYNKARKERLHPVADMVLPLGELPADYTRKLAYGDDVTMGDRANALLGLF